MKHLSEIGAYFNIGDSGKSSGSEDSGGSADNTDNEPTITATTVANPNNVLSVYMDWTTKSPMDSEVQFGVNGYQFRIHDDTKVTNHRVLVIGMHDHDGLPVWYYIHGTDNDRGGALSTELLVDSNTILIGPTGVPPNDVPPREVDLSGKIIWEGPANVSEDEQLSHHVSKLSNGNYLLLRWMKTEGEPTNARLEEVNACTLPRCRRGGYNIQPPGIPVYGYSRS